MDDERERRDLEDAERRARQGSPQPGSKDAGSGSDRGGSSRGSNGGRRF
jgi:hypothetical protein